MIVKIINWKMFCFFWIQYFRELLQKFEKFAHDFLYIHDANFQKILSKFRNLIRKFFRFDDDVSNLLYNHRKKFWFFLFILRVCLRKNTTFIIFICKNESSFKTFFDFENFSSNLKRRANDFKFFLQFWYLTIVSIRRFLKKYRSNSKMY